MAGVEFGMIALYCGMGDELRLKLWMLVIAAAPVLLQVKASIQLASSWSEESAAESANFNSNHHSYIFQADGDLGDVHRDR